MIVLNTEELLRQQVEQVAEKKPSKRIKGVEYSKSTGIEYNAALQYMVRLVKNDIDENLLPLLRKLAPEYQADAFMVTKDGYVDDITAALKGLVATWISPDVVDVAGQVASKFVNTANGITRTRFNESMRSFGLDIFGDSPAIQDYVDAAIYDNTQLITSIPEQYIARVQSTVMTNVRAGGRPSTIAKALQEQFGVEKNRAKMIARDQTAKLSGDLAAKRQQSSGFEYFQWIDSDDERVRTRHKQIDEKVTQYGKGIYRWDNPPKSDRGTPIIPSQDYQCRCIARPVTAAEVEQNQLDGNTKKGVKR